MKTLTLILILLLLLSGCAGHTLGIIYQYDSDQDIKIESKKQERQVDNIGI